MEGLKQAVFIIYSSKDGKGDWQLVKPEDVPEWLKAPDVMGRLAHGYVARNDRIVGVPDDAKLWYRADRVLEPAEQAAQAKRARKNARRATTVH